MARGVDSILRPEKYSSDYDDDARKRVTAIFKRFDKNDDGKITYEELTSIFQGVDPDHWNEVSVRRLLKAIDANKDGSIRYEELLEWIMGKSEGWSEARQAFMLKGKHCFCPGDVIVVNRQVEKHSDPFEIEIDLSSGGKLGAVLASPDGKSILVKAVRDGGLLAGWNTENPSEFQVTVGARMTEMEATVYTEKLKGKDAKSKSHVQVSKAQNDPSEMIKLLKLRALLKILVQPCEASNTYSVKLADSYEDLITMHEGVRAVVKKVKHIKTEGLYAVKSVFKKKMPKDTFISEFETMMQLDHPNVLPLLEVFEDHHCVHLVVPLCEGGELLEQVLENDKFNERQSARCMQQVLGAVRYLHSQSICHRDVKACNVLLETACDLDRALLKLVDFGNACRIQPELKMKTVMGSAEYMSVEMVAWEGYTCLCDVWSCGVLMYVLLGGYPPFMGDTDGQTTKLIRTYQKTKLINFGGLEWNEVSDEAKDLIQAMLASEDSRPTAEAAYQNRWIKDLAPGSSVGKLEHTAVNIRAFSSQCRVKKLARYALARNLNVDEVESLRREFELLDKNGDGSVTYHELKSVLDRSSEKCAEQMRKDFEGVDVDGNKRIEYTEFLAAALDQKLHCEEHGCWMAFNVFDRDGSGMISKKELMDILQNDEKCAALTQTMNLESTTNSIARCLAECDADQDGQIDFEEFLAMMRGEKPQPDKHVGRL